MTTTWSQRTNPTTSWNSRDVTTEGVYVDESANFYVDENGNNYAYFFSTLPYTTWGDRSNPTTSWTQRINP